MLVDGFDSATISVVVPQLATEWGLDPSNFTVPIAATNAGVAVSYMVDGRLAARLRTTPTVYAGLLVASLGSALSATVLVTESRRFSPHPCRDRSRHRSCPSRGDQRHDLTQPGGVKQRISVIVTLGLASGIAVGGFVGQTALTRWGPAGVYWVAAAATIVVAAVATTALPWRDEPVTHSQDEPGQGAPRPGVPLHDAPSLGFLVPRVITAYRLTSWIPTILLAYGFAPSDAPIGLTYLSIGGVFGGLCLIGLAARLGIGRAMVVAAAIGIVFLAALGLAGRAASRCSSWSSERAPVSWRARSVSSRWRCRCTPRRCGRPVSASQRRSGVSVPSSGPPSVGRSSPCRSHRPP